MARFLAFSAALLMIIQAHPMLKVPVSVSNTSNIQGHNVSKSAEMVPCYLPTAVNATMATL